MQKSSLAEELAAAEGDGKPEEKSKSRTPPLALTCSRVLRRWAALPARRARGRGLVGDARSERRETDAR